jgi:hypothetical protein
MLGLFGILSQFMVMDWDGSYGVAEFQMVFQDRDRQPVEGIELRVEDRRGRTFYHYPVTDYLPDQVPTSDSNGLMVFHHADSGIEYGGRCWFLFGLFPVDERPGPVYVCRFLHRGGEVYRIPFRVLDSWRRTGEQVPKVKRQWRRSDWPMSQLLLPNGVDDRRARVMKLFDLDGDGEFDPEEGAAWHAGTNWKEEEAAIARLKGEDPVEEVEFPLVRRTVIIQPNPE